MKKIIYLCVLLIMSLVSCNKVSMTPTSTLTPSSTSQPTETSTNTPTRTPRPTATPLPVFINLISPFSSTCGDGNPIIWGNDAYNWVWYSNCSDDTHGHVDWLIPAGCYIDNQGDIVAPIDGSVESYAYTFTDGAGKTGTGVGMHFYLMKNQYPIGILEALKFVGVPEPTLNKINKMHFDFGHIEPTVSNGSTVKQGEPIAEIVTNWNGQKKLAIKFVVVYKGIGDIVISPSLLPYTLPDGTTLLPMLDGTKTNWTCQPGSPYDCVPELKDYAPTCKFP